MNKPFDITYEGHLFRSLNSKAFVCSRCKYYCFLDIVGDYILWNDANYDGFKNYSCDEFIIKSIIE
jgi:hypothetical protein